MRDFLEFWFPFNVTKKKNWFSLFIFQTPPYGNVADLRDGLEKAADFMGKKDQICHNDGQ